MLDSKSIWVYTKQVADFDGSFKAAKLFADIIGREHINIEDYFAENHTQYDIKTNRHRMLICSQLYGLITKRHFTKKASTTKGN